MEQGAPSNPPTNKVGGGGGMVANHPNRNDHQKIGALTQQQITLFLTDKVLARHNTMISCADMGKGCYTRSTQDITMNIVEEQETETDGSREVEHGIQME